MARQVQDIQFEYTPLDLKDAVLYKPPFELIKEGLTNKAKAEAANYGLSNIILPEVLSEVDYLPENAEEAESILSGYNDRINDITKSLQENPSDKNALENLYTLSKEIHENTMSPRGKLSIMQRRIDALAAFDEANAQYRKEDPDRYEIFRNQVKDKLLNADSEIDMTNAIGLLQTQLNIPKGYIEDFEKAFEQKIKDYGYDKMGQSSPDIAMQEANAAMMGLTDQDKNGNTTTMGSYLAQEYDGQMPEFLIKRNGEIIINPELHAKDMGYAQMAYNLYENLIKIQQVPVSTKSKDDDDGDGKKTTVINSNNDSNPKSTYSVKPDFTPDVIRQNSKSSNPVDQIAVKSLTETVFTGNYNDLPDYYHVVKNNENDVLADVFQNPEVLASIAECEKEGDSRTMRGNDMDVVYGNALVESIPYKSVDYARNRIEQDGIRGGLSQQNFNSESAFKFDFLNYEVIVEKPVEFNAELASIYKKALSRIPDNLEITETPDAKVIHTEYNSESMRKVLVESWGYDYNECKQNYARANTKPSVWGYRLKGTSEWNLEHNDGGNFGADIWSKMVKKAEKKGSIYTNGATLRNISSGIWRRLNTIKNQNQSVSVNGLIWNTDNYEYFKEAKNVKAIEADIQNKASQDIAMFDWSVTTKDINTKKTTKTTLDKYQMIHRALKGGDFKLIGVLDNGGELGFRVEIDKKEYDLIYDGPVEKLGELLDTVKDNTISETLAEKLANRDLLITRKYLYNAPIYNGKQTVYLDEKFMKITGQNIPLYIEYYGTNQDGKKVKYNINGVWKYERDLHPDGEMVCRLTFCVKSNNGYVPWTPKQDLKDKDGNTIYNHGKNIYLEFRTVDDAANTIDATLQFTSPDFTSHSRGIVNPQYSHQVARYLGFSDEANVDALLANSQDYTNWMHNKNIFERVMMANYMVSRGIIRLNRTDCSAYCFALLNKFDSRAFPNPSKHTQALIDEIDESIKNKTELDNGFKLISRQSKSNVDYDAFAKSMTPGKLYVCVFDRNNNSENHMCFLMKVTQIINGKPQETIRISQFSQAGQQQTTSGMNTPIFDETYVNNLKNIKNLYLLEPQFSK